MGIPNKPARVKLIIGLIYKGINEYFTVKPFLLRAFGPIDFESPELEFNCTDYYEREFGCGLRRRFISFSRLIGADSLAAIKCLTNKMEKKMSCCGRRKINIDPGYINMSKLVLASTKDFCHRIYLCRGIFAEVTLVYKKGSFTSWEWTYPDYRAQEYINIFNQIRQEYASQICSRHT